MSDDNENGRPGNRPPITLKPRQGSVSAWSASTSQPEAAAPTSARWYAARVRWRTSCHWRSVSDADGRVRTWWNRSTGSTSHGVVSRRATALASVVLPALDGPLRSTIRPEGMTET